MAALCTPDYPKNKIVIYALVLVNHPFRGLILSYLILHPKFFLFGVFSCRYDLEHLFQLEINKWHKSAISVSILDRS